MNFMRRIERIEAHVRAGAIDSFEELMAEINASIEAEHTGKPFHPRPIHPSIEREIREIIARADEYLKEKEHAQ